MAKYFFDYAQNPRTRQIVELVSAQSLKTQNSINLLLWRAKNRPVTSMWVMASSDNCKEFAKKRLNPAFEDCAAIKEILPKDRTEWTATLIQFDTMNLLLRGSNSRIGLQSDPVGFIICDERREYKKGAIDLVRKRMRTFADSLEISMGTAGVKDDDLHRDFINGSQTFFHWNCPKCQHSQPFRFGKDATPLFPQPRERGGLVWDENETTRPGGLFWNFDEVRKTVRYECENCGERFKNSDKLKLLSTLHEHHRNPKALPKHVSLHWNALYMPWPNCDWPEIVVEFLVANHAKKLGDIEPLKAFVTETLGEPWEDRGEKVIESELLARCGDYVAGECWPENEAVKIITVDRQHTYLVVVLRQWKRGGDSRRIRVVRLAGYDELADFQRENGVKDKCVWLDYNGPNVATLRRECVKHGKYVRGRHGELIWEGWTPLIGDDADHFIRHENGKSIHVFWKKSECDPEIGTTREGLITLPLYFWSNPHFKDKLYTRYMRGQGPLWELPKNTEKRSFDELSAEEKVDLTDAKGVVTTEWRARGANHEGDCELMHLVVADIGGLTRILKA